jgi:copper chaperone
MATLTMQAYIHFFQESAMIELNLPDMTCGHCASNVAKTVARVDPAAKVEVDLNSKQVKIQTVQDRHDFAAALSEAGYPPAP